MWVAGLCAVPVGNKYKSEHMYTLYGSSMVSFICSSYTSDFISEGLGLES